MSIENEPLQWMPYEQYIASKFIYEIAERTTGYPLLWGKPVIIDKNERYNIAKEVYEKYSNELPIAYLEYYKP